MKKCGYCNKIAPDNATEVWLNHHVMKCKAWKQRKIELQKEIMSIPQEIIEREYVIKEKPKATFLKELGVPNHELGSAAKFFINRL